jgi:hypothetical protein
MAMPGLLATGLAQCFFFLVLFSRSEASTAFTAWSFVVFVFVFLDLSSLKAWRRKRLEARRLFSCVLVCVVLLKASVGPLWQCQSRQLKCRQRLDASSLLRWQWSGL